MQRQQTNAPAVMEADDWGKVSAFVDKQLELLNAERDAEIEQTRALQEGFSPKV